MVAAVAMLAVSCSKEDNGVSNGNNFVTFKVTAPELATRAIGDGTTAQTLHYAVYDEAWNHIPALDGTTTINITADVQMELLDGKVYNFIFWAQNDAAPYTFDAVNKKMTVNYAGIKANDENLDAFYATVENMKVQGGITKTVELFRPFAQLNIATLDWNAMIASGETFNQTEVKVKAYDTLDFVSGGVSGLAERTFNFEAMPAETLSVNNVAYKWMAMNYLLVNEKELVEVTLNANNSNVAQKAWGNVPVQRNHRTHILGKLLTSPVDFEVIIRPAFEEPDFVPEVTATVSTVAELEAAIAAATEPTVIEAEAGTYTFAEIKIPANKEITIQPAETRAGESEVILDGQFFVTGTLYLDGVVINNANATSEGISKKANNAIYVQSEGEVVVTNSTFNISKATGITSWWSTGEAQTNVVVKNCVFNCNGNRPLQIEANATIEGCTFNDPYRYAAQLTASDAVINFKNNKLTQSKTSGKATYGLQLTCDYGNSNLVINGEGNVIEGRGADDALYVWELGTGTSNGVVDIATITLNATDGKFYVLDGDVFAIAISSVKELKAFAEEVNAGDSYAKKSVVLLNDLDLENSEWTPIGNGSNPFQGNFNGLGHKIMNLNITGYNSYVGLFGNTNTGKIENLTIENAQVSGRLYVGAVVGHPYTTQYENITVKGLVQVSGMAYVGGVGGKDAYTNWTNITVAADAGSYVKANSVENGVAYRTYVGGVIGFMGEGGHAFTNVTSNIDVIGSTIDVGGITGIAHYGNSFINCKSSGNVEITEAEEAEEADQIGGIAGVWHNENGQTVTFTNCEFTGALKVNVEGVDLSDNIIVGDAYNNTGKGKLIIDGVVASYTVSAADADALKAALEDGATTINLAAGEYTMPAANFTPNTVINCAEGTVFTGSSSLNINGATIIGAEFSNPAGNAVGGNINGTFKGCEFTGSNATRYTYAGQTVVFEDCVFSGDVYGIHFDGGENDVIFRNCTISGFNGLGAELTMATFEGCTFVGNDKSGYNGANLWGSAKLVNCEFTFDGTTANEWIDCIGADKTYEFVNCTINGEAYTAENYKEFDEIFSRNDVAIKINGVECAW